VIKLKIPSSLRPVAARTVLLATAVFIAGFAGTPQPQPRRYEVIETVAPDGFRSPAILEFPQGEGPFPGVVAVHWGMGGQTAAIIEKMVNTEWAPSRELVRQGYAVLTSDYRHASHINLEIDDTIAAYEYLRNHPRVIKDKVALCGTSHGAVCSIYAGMRIRPACIVAEEGATDLAYRYERVQQLVKAHQGPLEGNLKLDKELWDELASRLGGTPSEVPDAYWKASAMARASEINSPILILAGDGEYLPHALEMYAALLKAKKECEFASFPKAPHGFWWSRRKIEALPGADEKVFAFLAKYLKN
jgi:dipeptidyl aminopeptidase/acylaminoacyl peptidase